MEVATAILILVRAILTTFLVTVIAQRTLPIRIQVPPITLPLAIVVITRSLIPAPPTIIHISSIFKLRKKILLYYC